METGRKGGRKDESLFSLSTYKVRVIHMLIFIKSTNLPTSQPRLLEIK